MKVFIITTEASGDFLGSELLKELKKRKIFTAGVGGKLMELNGFKSWISIEKFNTIGLFEVLIRFPKFLYLLKVVENKVRENPPDIIITIDSPSFNYRLVKKIQDLRISTQMVHYVAPTVWAWKEYRAKIFSELYDKLFTLFEFENKYFTKFGLKTKWVGHQIFSKKIKIKKKKKIIFLPGSRETEIKKNLLLMKHIIKDIQIEFPNYKYYVLTFDHYKDLVKLILKNDKIQIISDQRQKIKIMNESFLAIAASGSVTLELCKFKTPMVVVYDTNFLTKFIVKMLVKVKYCSLINIFFNKEIVPEFVFEKFTYDNVISEFRSLIKNKKKRSKQVEYMNLFSKKMLSCIDENPARMLVNEILKKK